VNPLFSIFQEINYIFEINADTRIQVQRPVRVPLKKRNIQLEDFIALTIVACNIFPLPINIRVG
jgi:hypothetical protein